MSSRPSRGAARLAAILDALPDALVLVNANGTVVNANTIALEAFEAPGTALVGRGLLDLLPHFDSRLIPGSMRRPESTDASGRTKPTRMIARRTDGHAFPVEVTSANLEDGRQAYDGSGYTGDELLMLVVRDLSGTVDTEAELARSQRQTEMILRAAAEGVVGTDTDGRIVLVNPAAAQILGYRASDLGGKELHTLVLHSREDGAPFPYTESPLHDTLRSGRKHRVRGQVLWSKAGNKVPVDLTTAPVRDGDELVGAVLTFTDRRPLESLTAERDEAVQRHEEELERLAEEHRQELERLAEKHTAELSALHEKHTDDLAAGDERYAALAEREKDRYEALTARHDQLLAMLAQSLRGPIEELRGELAKLAADDAGQLWPEANQVLHHLAAGYSRITTLVDNVLGFQRLEGGEDTLARTAVMLDAVVSAGVEGAIELIGPGRVQFAVHAPPIEAEVDPVRLAQALAHLVADVAGVDATGNAPVSAGGYMDNTVVVAAAQRGEVVRIEVRGPYAGGDPVHQPIVGGIVRAHGGVLQTHEVPGMSGSAYVLEVPIGDGAGAVTAPVPGMSSGRPGTELALFGQVQDEPAPAEAERDAAPQEPAAQQQPTVPRQGGEQQGGGRRRARRSSVDAFLDSEVGAPAPASAPASDEVAGTAASAPTGRRRRRAAEAAATSAAVPAQATAPQAPQSDGAPKAPASNGTGRRRGRPSPAENGAAGEAVAEGAVTTAAEHAAGTPAAGLGQAVPPGGVPVAPTGRRARRDAGPQALPPALPAAVDGNGEGTSAEAADPDADGTPTGRRRRALVAANERAAAADSAPRTVFALPPAAADRAPEHSAPVPEQADEGRHDLVRHDQADGHTPPQPHPVPTPAGEMPVPAQGTDGAQPAPAAAPEATPQPEAMPQPQPVAAEETPAGEMPAASPAPDVPASPQSWPASPDIPEGGTPLPRQSAPQPTPSGGTPLPPERTAAPAASPPQAPRTGGPRAAQPLPAEASAPADPNSTQGRAFSVRTLGQGVPFARQGAQPGATQPRPLSATPPPQQPSASGRRRKLGTPPEPAGERPETAARPHPQQAATATTATTAATTPAAPLPGQAPSTGKSRLTGPGSGIGASEGAGRSYAIGAPDENADEGPEPLDGPGGAIEVADRPQAQPMDDELPPEPLDNPRRLLVWPAPDATTQQALGDRGYRPVVVNSREEIDAQIAAFPAALFVDPLTGPITRTALQSLRQAAVAAEVPVLVTAGLGQATREAAYGADPAVLLKALAPRDSEQHPPRVLLIEEHAEIALALTAALERRGMQVARAASDADAVTLASQMRPNLVVMDLMQVHRRQAGVVDWLRANQLLDRTPLVVYTAAVDEAELPRLVSGETVLFLAERSTSTEVQERIVDLLARIGTN
ncbi:PAS domain-containing protein [Streptomyces sp. NPDC048664]|uniref:PAS domain-containing protein n=1 Tax=Streptomyces sp. NPDC048664 TaxID=3154505 RepID=UPI00342E0984